MHDAENQTSQLMFNQNKCQLESLLVFLMDQ